MSLKERVNHLEYWLDKEGQIDDLKRRVDNLESESRALKRHLEIQVIPGPSVVKTIKKGGEEIN